MKIHKYDLIGLIKSGNKLPDIARHYKCSPSTINLYIKKYDLNYKELRQDFLAEEVAKIKILASKNLTTLEIAKQLRMRRDYVRYYAKKHGIKIRHQYYYDADYSTTSQ
jgi:intein-encoded DNA endonuclease-like protein